MKYLVKWESDTKIWEQAVETEGIDFRQSGLILFGVPDELPKLIVPLKGFIAASREEEESDGESSGEESA